MHAAKLLAGTHTCTHTGSSVSVSTRKEQEDTQACTADALQKACREHAQVIFNHEYEANIKSSIPLWLPAGTEPSDLETPHS